MFTLMAALKPIMDDLRLPPYDPTLITQSVIRRRIQMTFCIENLSEKSGWWRVPLSNDNNIMN
jgi:hypothetical protein